MFSVLLSALVSLGPSAEQPAPESTPSPAGEEAESPDEAQEAKEAVDAAREAGARGDYAQAAKHFERALQLRPSPALHYNIAVCHHRIMLDAPADSEAREQARAAAVDAYNRYLEAAPDAPDRQAVAETVSSLGGRPKTLDEWTIDPDPDEASGPPSLRHTDPWHSDPTEDNEISQEGSQAEGAEEDESSGATEPDVQPTDPAPPNTGSVSGPPGSATAEWLDFPKGRIGLGFYVGIANIGRQGDTAAVETLPVLGGVLRGGGFVGRRRELNVGGEFGIHGQPTTTDAAHFVTGGYLALTTEYARRVGPGERIEVGGGGLLGLTREVLRHRGQTTLTCPRQDSGAVTDRGGALLGGRFVLNLLLGKRRRHELSLRITPALAVYAPASKGSGDSSTGGSTTSPCDDDLDGYKELGLNGPALVMTVDIGYAPRF